ncbi:hypothetical protein [Sporosarcina sp. FSL K6-2383]|uniref:hypothetical protein n=1 Tax=Sporosarcina sp. FSL K6-2383 TaxID=2921556 RepID=UPI00315B2629
MIARWLAVNVLTVLLLITWSLLYQGFDSYTILTGKVFAHIAFVLFLVNINMYFVFLFIRKSKVRAVKVKFAKLSRKMMKYHVAIAVTATILIIVHAFIIIKIHVDDLLKLKTMSGFLAASMLVILLFSGLLRRKKATGIRRKFHYTMAFIFLGFVLLHILL